MYWMGQEDQRDDIAEFVKAFSTQFPKIGKKDAILVMAHGTPHPANATTPSSRTASMPLIWAMSSSIPSKAGPIWILSFLS